MSFFCEKPEEKRKKLHEVRTFRLDAKVRRDAIDTGNTILYSKMQNGDMCAQNAEYHTECLCKLYRDAENSRIGTGANDNDRKLHGLALSRVISFIDETMRSMDPETIPLFKLADIARYYSEYLQKCGIENYKVHSTRLKQRIMEHFDDMYEQQGRDIILGFTSDLSDIISSATNCDFDNEGVILAEAGKILRRDILEMNDTVFMFNQNCQEDSIHDSVKCILSTILHGNVTSSPHYKQAILTIGQLHRLITVKIVNLLFLCS